MRRLAVVVIVALVATGCGVLGTSPSSFDASTAENTINHLAVAVSDKDIGGIASVYSASYRRYLGAWGGKDHYQNKTELLCYWAGLFHDGGQPWYAFQDFRHTIASDGLSAVTKAKRKLSAQSGSALEDVTFLMSYDNGNWLIRDHDLLQTGNPIEPQSHRGTWCAPLLN